MSTSAAGVVREISRRRGTRLRRPELNITEPIRRIARLQPATPAIVRLDGSVINYAALEQGIDSMAARASRLGLRAGDTATIGVFAPDEATSISLMLALARIGVTTADHGLPGHQGIVFQLADAKYAGPRAVVFDASWLQDDAPVAPIHDDPLALVRIVTSSGTTGRPKQIGYTHDLMERRVYARWLDLTGIPPVCMIAIPLHSAWGYGNLLRTLWAGGTVVLFNPRDPIAPMRRHGVTHIVASTLVLGAILSHLPRDAEPPPALEQIEVAGSAVPRVLAREAMERLCPDLTVYLGATEVGGIAVAPARMLFAEGESRPGLAGLVGAGVRVQAVDEADQPLPPGSEGILRVRTRTHVDGYLDGTDPTGAFRNGWFYPGDVGTVWPDGMVSLVGRSSEIINSGGVKVSPTAIEERLLRLPGVTEAAAFGVPDSQGIERIWAAIVADPPVEEAVLDAFCDRSPTGEAPEVILRLTALPKTESGKVLRRTLRDMALTMAR
jgi:acyl-CoA synthetase (AMP-forming)/AMP-acid ligase II